MTIQLTKTADGFEITSPQLPAPLVLSTEAGQGLAAALYGDLTPAFKQDKCAFAPQSREPVGLWINEDGTIALWLAGVNHPLTADEAKALGGEAILATAPVRIGDEIITAMSLTTSSDGTTGNLDGRRIETGSIGKVSEVIPGPNGSFTYKLDFDGDIAPGCSYPAGFKEAPPEQDYRVTQNGIHYVYRDVTVRARTDTQAYKLGVEAFKSLPDAFGWNAPIGAPEFDPSNLDAEVARTPEQDADDSAAEGWTVSTDVGIRCYKDADNNAKFTTIAEAVDYVADWALKGSPRHAAALRKHLAAVAVAV